MRRKVIDGWYQLPDFPSVPLTPSNIWKTMQLLEGIEVLAGEEPKLQRREDYFSRFYQEEPWRYHATFYSHLHRVAIVYEWRLSPFSEATFTMCGEESNIREAARAFRLEHSRLREKLQKKSSN